MDFQDLTASDTGDIFGTNFSGKLTHSFSPGPLPGNFPTQQASSATRDGRPDAQTAPESHEIVQAVHELTKVEYARGQRQDQQLKDIQQEIEALKERVQAVEALVGSSGTKGALEALAKQMNALRLQLNSSFRRSNPLPPSSSAHNTQGARSGHVPVPETAPRDPVERSALPPQQGKVPHDFQQMLRFLQQQQQQHQSSPTGLPFPG
ncbi:hypothetical protein PMIN06_009290 [Paraphaeosphaeria minitans]